MEVEIEGEEEEGEEVPSLSDVARRLDLPVWPAQELRRLQQAEAQEQEGATLTGHE